MARNKIQFQKGLSERQFRASYGTEEQCRRALAAWRWPQGFVCPRCDALGCFGAVTQAGCRHQPIVTGGGAQAVQIPAFKWVNTTIGNIKNSIRGTYHAIRPKHVPRYLAQFEYRFNRRYRLEDMITRLTWVALRTPPMPYRLLKLAENGA